jgi:tetratricopeptide (TPR) repeat protein
MKPILYFFLFFYSLVNINYAQSGSSPPDREVLDGLDDVYNLKFDEAENRFKRLQQSNPDDLKGYFYESLLYFYRAMPARDNAMYEKYLDLSDKVIERAEKLLDKNENDYDALYYTGLSHSYRSLLMLSLDKSLLKAASDGNDGYRILSALIEKKPDYYDAYMGLGLYKIAIGFVPEKFQWILSLIGFNGNIKEGVRLLKISMQKGKYTRVDSKVCLSIFSLKEKEDEDGESLILSKELTEEYPESAVFKVFYAGLLLQHGLNEEGIEAANEALNLNKNSFSNEIKKTANAVLGTAYFKMNDFQKAIFHFEEFMKYINPEDRYNVYLFTLGVSYELTGNRSKAVQCYQRTRDNFVNERDGELDKFFYRLAQGKINFPLNDFEKKMIDALNLRESNKLNDAINAYKDILDSKILSKYKSNDELILFYFNYGLAYTYNKDFDKAMECFSKCIKLNPESEKWLLPHSYFELGKIYNRKGDKEKSVEMFDRIFDYDDYDFESFLQMRLANYKNR